VLTLDEIQELKESVNPINEEDLEDMHERLETLFRKHYFDTSRIFKYYAAGGEGGGAFDLSMTEWWQLANDCQYPGGKDPNKIEKTDIERCFHETEVSKRFYK